MTFQRLLKETNPFVHFDDTHRAEISALAHQRRFGKGEFGTLHGELWPYLILVLEGSLHGVKESEEGRNLVVITLTQGNVFWGLTFFDKESTIPVSLQSTKSGSLVSWSRDDLLPFLLVNGEALWSGDTYAALSIPTNKFVLIYATGGSKKRTQG